MQLVIHCPIGFKTSEDIDMQRSKLPLVMLKVQLKSSAAFNRACHVARVAEIVSNARCPGELDHSLMANGRRQTTNRKHSSDVVTAG